MANIFRSNEFFEVLREATIADVANLDRNLVTLSDANSVSYALSQLAEHKILSAPVVDTNGTVVGTFDRLAALRYVFGKLPDVSEISADTLNEFPFAKTSVKDVLDATPLGSKFITVLQNNPSTFLVELFQNSVHRTVVYGQRQSNFRYSVVPVGVCSQSDLIKYMAKHISDDRVKNTVEIPIKRFGLEAEGKVVSVDEKETTLAALHKIQELGLHRVAVVNAEGKLSGNLSASDLRSLSADALVDLLLPVGEYLKKHSIKSLSPITVKETDAFGDLLELFSTNHLHHAWIVDEESGKPTGVVTLTDFARAVVSFRSTPDEKQPKTVLAVPADVQVRLVGVNHLNITRLSSHAPVRVSLRIDGHAERQSPTVHVSGDTGAENFGDDAVFNVRLTPDDVDKQLTFSVYHPDNEVDLGDVSLKVSWILDGFGSSSGAVKSYRESLKLAGTSKGEIEVDLLHTAI